MSMSLVSGIGEVSNLAWLRKPLALAVPGHLYPGIPILGGVGWFDLQAGARLLLADTAEDKCKGLDLLFQLIALSVGFVPAVAVRFGLLGG